MKIKAIEARVTNLGADHVICRSIDGQMRLECRHCGRSVALVLPVDVGDFGALSDAYVTQHRYCEPKEQPEAK